MRARIMAIVSMTVAILMLAALTASAAPKPPKHWNLYQDKLGAYVCTTGDPKGQTLIAHPFATQAECLGAMTTPPTIEYVLTPAAPNGAADWYVSDVSLDWTVTFLPGLELAPEPVLDGCVDQIITADQPKTTYTCTATTVFGVSAGPVSIDVKRDATKPSITWSGGIQDGDSFEVGTVPDEPTIVAEDAMSGVASSGLTGYGKDIGKHTLTATATDVAGNQKVEQRGYTVYAHPAQVVEPTATDETCGGPGVVLPGSITIPDVPGVEYSIDGVVTAAGPVDLPAGTYQVTATALPDYELVGYPEGGWSVKILAADCIVPVDVAEPFKVDEACVGPGLPLAGGITIPLVTGVEYSINGEVAADGWHNLPPGTYTVTATALPGYALVGYPIGGWPYEILTAGDCLVHVTAEAPTKIADETCNGTTPVPGSVQIPNVVGVDYLVNGALVADGSVFPASATTLSIEAQPEFGHALDGQTTWQIIIAPATCAPKQIEFVGGAGGEYSGALTLPAGSQAGDLAVVFVTMNYASLPGTPNGYTSPSGWSMSNTSAGSAYKVSYRYLVAGDTTVPVVGSYRTASVMVYRHAAVGAFSGYASSDTQSPYQYFIPGLTLQAPGTSWVGSFAWVDNTVIRGTTLAGLTNRMAGVTPSASTVAGYDTNGGVSSFAQITVPGNYAKIAGASFELKLVP